MDDLQHVCSNSPQFEELSALAAQYRTDIRNFKTLQTQLEEHIQTDRPRAIDLGAELARCHVLNRHRLERCIAGPVAKETEEFVRRVCVALRQTENPVHASQRVARHGIHEFRLIPEVTNIISRAVVEAVLLSGGDARSAISDRVVSEMDALWVDLCQPIIEGERKSLQNELPAARKLASFVTRLLQMKKNGRPASTIHATAKAEICGVAHALYRFSTDDWYKTARISSAELTATCACAYDEGVGRRLEQWLDQHGAVFHDAVVADCASIEALRATSEYALEWHGLHLHDSADDPATAALVEPPRYLGSFNSPTGRIYALPITTATATASATTSAPMRIVGVVRTMHVLRSLIANGMFSLGAFKASYALELVDREQQLIACKTSGILSSLLTLCEDFNFPADATAIDRFVDALVRQRDESAVSEDGRNKANRSSKPTAASFSSCCAVPVAGHPGSVSSSSTASSIETTTVATQPTSHLAHHGRDFLVRPDAKHKAVEFSPSRVARVSLLEYIVVYSLAAMVNEILASSRTSLDTAAVAIANSSIVQRVAMNVQRLHRTHGSPLNRVIASADHDAAGNATTAATPSINAMALKQMVSFIVKKVLKAGLDGTIAAQRVGAPKAMPWVASYKPTRGNNELLLHLGSGAHDPACYLFLDVCVRVKSHLDESWPLAEGMAWPKAESRRGNASRAKAPATPASPAPQAETRDTACTSSNGL